MSLEATLRVLNEMQAAGVIGPYAVGGAVAAFLYVEPGTTFDLDVFVTWETSPSGLLDLSPLYSDLQQRGYAPRREGVMIEGWEVQFLPTHSPLDTEALAEAVEVEIGGVPTRIFTQEHLMAICLQTGRPKDTARLVQFVQQGRPDETLLIDILRRHGLEGKWTTFRHRFLT